MLIFDEFTTPRATFNASLKKNISRHMNYLNFNQTEWILLAAVLLYLILLHLASWMLF